MSQPTTVPIWLLDVNVLVALVMPNHESHATARTWFAASAPAGWATTPVTESGFVRVCSNRRAIVTATTPAIALEMLALLTAQPGHEFWADEVRGVVGTFVDAASVRNHGLVTDAHLLALAIAHDGRLVTFDRGMAGLSPAAPGTVEVLPSGDPPLRGQ